MQRSVLLLGVSVALLAALGLFMRTAPPAEVEWRTGSISEFRESMRSLIRTLGPDRAYAGLKERYEEKDFGASHNAAHLFGETLYELYGVEGVAACDPGFNFGCYHGFFTAAVAGEGLDVVTALDAACGRSGEDRAPACQHGIGHGILEYLGHNNLVAALEACDLTDQPDPLAGCTGGVFMEYNVPLVYTEEGSYTVETRPYDETEGPYAPCGDVDQRFQGSCVQELPQWWNQVFDGDFARMGALCAQLPENAISICVSGVGKIVPSSSGYSVTEAERLCGLMPEGWYDTCITQASWSFEVNTGSHEEAVALCAYASEQKQVDCPI